MELLITNLHFLPPGLFVTIQIALLSVLVGTPLGMLMGIGR